MRPDADGPAQVVPVRIDTLPASSAQSWRSCSVTGLPLIDRFGLTWQLNLQ